MHKTGTTALQYFLYENRERLKKYGWYYPDFYSFAGVSDVSFINGSTLLCGIENGRIDTEADWYVGLWDYIRDCLTDNHVILS